MKNCWVHASFTRKKNYPPAFASDKNSWRTSLSPLTHLVCQRQNHLPVVFVKGNDLKQSPIIIFITQLAHTVLLCATATPINFVLKYCVPIPFDT